MPPIEIVGTVEDSDGDTATTLVRINDDATIAGMQGFAEAFYAAMGVLMHGAIIAANAVLRPSTSGLTSNTALAGSDIHRQGKFEFITAEGNRVKMNLPALAESVGQGAGQDSLDMSDTEVAAFLSAMENGITVSGQLVRPCDIAGDSLVDTLFAREAFKNSGKRAS